MFTGLVEAKSHLVDRSPLPSGESMTFAHTFPDLVLGESIAVQGACLTVVAFDHTTFRVELSTETLALTTLGKRKAGDAVNLERALRAGDRLGGHMVTGHVDGVGVVTKLAPQGEMTQITIEIPPSLVGYVARKGSLTVDGVSLTVNAVQKSHADLLIIPHTRAVTTLGTLGVGQEVNLEVDLVARYVERLLESAQK
jgi:riboflavin synthase